jgi:hypothetical protein
VNITFYRLLDEAQSFCRRTRKQFRAKRKWGACWKDMTRSGRRYTRVEFSEVGFGAGEIDISRHAQPEFRIRPEPGWEWYCPNCKTYSIVTESMMPQVLSEWEYLAQSCKARGLLIPKKPTAATAGCTNCNYRPGAPE